MSNIALFKSGSANVPAFFNDADDFTKQLAGGVASSTKTISVDGGVWRMLAGGEEIAKNEDRAMNFVVVGSAPDVARVYYEGAYVKGQTSTPSCYSLDSKTPAPGVANPQSRNCASCPQNVSGSGSGSTKACKFFMNIAVVLEGDMSGSVYRMRLGQTSVFAKPDAAQNKSGMGFKAYAKHLAGHNVSMSAVVTEARFDTSASVPILKFSAVRPITEEEFPVIKAQREVEDTKTAIEVSFAAPKPASADAPAIAAPVAAAPSEPVKRPSKVKEATPAGKSVDQLMNDWGADDEE